MIEFRLLGPVEVHAADRVVDAGQPRQRAVLAALLVEAGRLVTSETLMDRVWGSAPPSRARHSLYSHVARVRHTLGQAAAVADGPPLRLLSRSGGYVLDVDPYWVDIHRFNGLVEGASALACADSERLTMLREALTLWRGEPLAGLTGDWAGRVRDTWHRRRLDAVVAWSRSETQVGSPNLAIGRLVELVADEPLVETLTAELMSALAAAGRTAEAIEAYHALRGRLDTELGVGPSPQTEQVYLRLLRRQPTAELAPAGLPRDIAAFTGRGCELATLASAVVDSGRVVGIHVVGGMPGVGKTALVVHAGHRLARHFPDGQFFVRLHAHTVDQLPVEPSEALASLLMADGVPVAMVPAGADAAATLDARASLWRARLAGRRVLLVLDDAADHRQVEPLLPTGPGCLVLVTSRRRLAALSGVVSMTLDTLPSAEAAALFIGLCGRDQAGWSDSERDRIGQLVEWCGHLPLAIALLAGRFRQHRSWQLTDLLDELAAARERLASMRAEDVAVTAALDLSYRGLSPDRQRLFRRLALHPGADIDRYAAAALDNVSPATAGQHLEGLFDEHLLIEDVPGRYRMHDLTREYATTLARQDDPVDRDTALAGLRHFYLGTARAANRHIVGQPPASREATTGRDAAAGPGLPDRRSAMAWMRAELTNLQAVAAMCAANGDHDAMIGLAAAMAGHLELVGAWQIAVDLHSSAARAAELIGDPRKQADALVNLAGARLVGDDYQAAADAALRAVAIGETAEDHRSRARAYHRLGQVRMAADDYPGGTAALTTALEISRDTGDHRGQAAPLIELGIAWMFISQYPASIDALTHAITICDAIHDEPGRAKALLRLGSAQWISGDCSAAVDTLTRALRVCGEIGDRPGQAIARNQLSAAHRLLGNYPQAVQDADRAEVVYREIGDRNGQAVALSQRGVALRLTGDHKAAVVALEQALRISRELGAQYEMATALTHLGAVWRLTGNHPAASSALSEAIQIRRAIGDPRGQAAALTQLAALWHATGDHPEATNALDEALQIHQRIDDRHGRATTLNIHGRRLLDRGNPKLARTQHRTALRLAREIRAPLEEADALAGCGRCAIMTGDTPAGLADLANALTTYQRIGATADARAITDLLASYADNHS